MGYALWRLQDIAKIIVDLVLYLVNTVLGAVVQILNIIGLKADLTPHTIVTYALAIVILAAFTYVTLKIISKWVYNSLIGLVLLFILRLFGVVLPINLFTVITVAFFGLGGLIALLVLYVAGLYPAV